MPKQIGAGDLRTRITVFDLPRDEAGEVLRDADGYPAQEPVNVFGPGGGRSCKWEDAWGSEVYAARQAGVTDPATLTLRYTPKITTTCTVFRGSDPRPYEVLSVRDIGDRHAWMEVKVQRKEAAK